MSKSDLTQGIKCGTSTSSNADCATDLTQGIKCSTCSNADCATNKVTRDDFYMLLAMNAALRDGTCDVGKMDEEHPKVGCVIRSSTDWKQRRQIISIGWNGGVDGLENSERQIQNSKELSQFTLHAEHNAVLFANPARLRGSVIYTTIFPCKKCLGVLMQVGVAEVVYLFFNKTEAKGSLDFIQTAAEGSGKYIVFHPFPLQRREFLFKQCGELGKKLFEKLEQTEMNDMIAKEREVFKATLVENTPDKTTTKAVKKKVRNYAKKRREKLSKNENEKIKALVEHLPRNCKGGDLRFSDSLQTNKPKEHGKPVGESDPSDRENVLSDGENVLSDGENNVLQELEGLMPEHFLKEPDEGNKSLSCKCFEEDDENTLDPSALDEESKDRQQEGRLSREGFSMLCAINAALRDGTRDAGEMNYPYPKVGCLIRSSLSQRHRRQVISIGWNGAVDGLENSERSFKRDQLNDFTLHAEHNAVLFANRDDLHGSVIYVTMIPCQACVRVLMQVGVAEVVYLFFNEKYRNGAELIQRTLETSQGCPKIWFHPFPLDQRESLFKECGELGKKLFKQLEKNEADSVLIERVENFITTVNGQAEEKKEPSALSASDPKNMKTLFKEKARERVRELFRKESKRRCGTETTCSNDTGVEVEYVRQRLPLNCHIKKEVLNHRQAPRHPMESRKKERRERPARKKKKKTRGKDDRSLKTMMRSYTVRALRRVGFISRVFKECV